MTPTHDPYPWPLPMTPTHDLSLTCLQNTDRIIRTSSHIDGPPILKIKQITISITITDIFKFVIYIFYHYKK